MKLPINWLKDYIQISADPKELIDKMTSIGHMQDGPPKQIAADIVYDLEIRQNRSDCYSIMGLAREAGAVLNQSITYPESLKNDLPPVSTTTQVEIKSPDLCYRFQTLNIENIKVGPSPEWLTKKLEAYGVKSINNVVDITNFVMIELGEPMHAYDIKNVTENIEVRLAKEGETLTVLGGKELELTADDLVIADSHKVLALAGIIGGEESSIKDDTTSIILEDATYNQATIRRASIRHQIRTEASTRHEKFLHPHLTTLALKRASQLLEELCGGSIVSHSDTYPRQFPEKKIELHDNHLQLLGGVIFTMHQAKEILEKLELPTTKKSEDTLEVTAPYWRTDIIQEADLIEEVLRIYGYDNIPSTLPHTPPPKDLQSKSTYEIEEKIKDILTACGFDEQITEPLTHENHSELEPIILENSLNADKTMLRTSLKNSLLSAFSNQEKYRKQDIHIFEVGKIYFKNGDTYVEDTMIAGLSTSTYEKTKGEVELLFERLGYTFSDSVVKIHPLTNSKSIYFDVRLKDILRQTPVVSNFNLFTSPPQVILQDLSLIMPENTKVGDIIKEIEEASKLIYKIKLGESPQKLKTGGKSLFLNITFYSSQKPITNDDVEVERTTILQMLDQNHQIKLR